MEDDLAIASEAGDHPPHPTQPLLGPIPPLTHRRITAPSTLLHNRPFSRAFDLPAFPPRWVDTPDDYTCPFADLHPWGQYVTPRRRALRSRENELTAALPLHVYHQILRNGHFSSRFVRLLFPRRFVGLPSPTNPVPVTESVQFEDINAFWQHAIQLIDDLLNASFQDDTDDIRRTPRRRPPMVSNPHPPWHLHQAKNVIRSCTKLSPSRTPPLRCRARSPPTTAVWSTLTTSTSRLKDVLKQYAYFRHCNFEIDDVERNTSYSAWCARTYHAPYASVFHSPM
ncbi:unnamed protein product [Haemonchus placei]|uniref:Uncharacterized protein n=1 Tax=Haemonchus placei TaxID=6290 RepID=A0A0N4WYX6_HAEPC|nr:unnamed protein product [Haemonchus placei]